MQIIKIAFKPHNLSVSFFLICRPENNHAGVHPCCRWWYNLLWSHMHPQWCSPRKPAGSPRSRFPQRSNPAILWQLQGTGLPPPLKQAILGCLHLTYLHDSLCLRPRGWVSPLFLCLNRSCCLGATRWPSLSFPGQTRSSTPWENTETLGMLTWKE